MHYKVLRPYQSRVPPYDDKITWKQWLNQMGLPHVTDYCSLNRSYLEDLLGMVGAGEFDDTDHFPGQMMFLINNLAFARQRAARYPGSRIFGVVFDPDPAGFVATPDLLGFDLLDRGGHYSLLEDVEWLHQRFGEPFLNQYALIDTLEQAMEVKAILRGECGATDWHARTCEIWAVYRTE